MSNSVFLWPGTWSFSGGTVTWTGDLTVTGTGSFGTAITIGTNPASIGAVRIPNATAIYARNALNDNNVNLIAANTSDQVEVGGTGFAINSSGVPVKVSGVATAGNGVVAIVGSGRSASQNAAVASVATYTVGAADATFVVSANVNVTTSTTHSFNATVTFTDETNSSRTYNLPFQNPAGVINTSAITNVTGAGVYAGLPIEIRCKASSVITIATSGTFTTVTYNVEGYIRKLG